MRISDWSSDVCSSDLANSAFGSRIEKKLLPLPPTTVRYNLTGLELFKLYCEALPGGDGGTLEDTFQRVRAQFLSDERDALQFMMPMEQHVRRSEEHTSELQSLMRISYAVFCLKK